MFLPLGHKFVCKWVLQRLLLFILLFVSLFALGNQDVSVVIIAFYTAKEEARDVDLAIEIEASLLN